jgi:hypothetical protein
LADSTATLTPPTSELVAEADGGNGAAPPTNGHAAVAGNGATPPKPKGLTLETLAQVTAKSSGEPLARVTPVAVTIEVRKPIKGAPLRAHPDIENFTTEAYSLTVKNPEAVGELVYMTHPDVAAAIPSFVRYQRFCFCWDGWQKKPFIWPMDVLLEGARNNNWAVSANRIWQAALKDWACVVPAAGAYALGKPVHPIKGDPPWPTRRFAEWMLIGFRDLYIEDLEHPEVKKRLITIVPE